VRSIVLLLPVNNARQMLCSRRILDQKTPSETQTNPLVNQSDLTSKKATFNINFRVLFISGITIMGVKNVIFAGYINRP
jgi:hypothetical protein